MDNSEKSDGITSREAIKKMGIAAAGLGLGIGSTSALDALDNTYDGRQMRVLLVNGSPHREGCTYTALGEVARALEENGIETEIYWIGTQPLAGCIGCGACGTTGRCFMKDIVNEFLDKAKEFDGFVFGAPVHFAAIPGLMTSFMNRAFFSARTHHEFQGKPAAAVTSSRRAGSLTTLDQFNRYFIHGGMPVVPSQYWPMVYGNTPDEVRRDGEGLQIMRTLGRNMAWMLKGIDIGVQAGQSYPEREPRVSTNFIR